MRAMKWMRKHPKTLASTAGVVIGTVTLTGMAMAYDGLPTTKVDLNDAGVWLTKTSSLMVGHFNSASTVIDGGLRTSGEEFDILQDEKNVLVVDGGNDTVTAVDPAVVALTDSAPIPGDAKVALGGTTTAILDRTSGFLWVKQVSELSGFDLKAADPLVKLGKNADVTVGRDGTVFAVSASKHEVVTAKIDAQGEISTAKSSLSELGKGAQPTITAVGDVPIVLDPVTGVVQTPGGFQTKIDDADAAVLQYPSDAADAVTLATTSRLVHVPLDGGDVQEVSTDSQGNPANPVSLRGCTYGAWAGSGRFVRDCAGDASDVNEKIPGGEKADSLIFRVNRDVIVLNDALTGAAWLADESLQQVDDWSVLTPPEGKEEDEEKTTEETVETTLPDRKEKNTPPTAENDRFGVRPGGTTLLPVVDNDNDPDGDVLVASLAEKQPSVGDVQPILNGGALQIMTDEDASGSATFRYEVDDGRGGKDTADVTVNVHDWSTNGAPKPKRVTKLAVESGGTVSYNVLPDWLDPDGDDVFLRSVTAAAGDEVDFTTDGQITYRAVASLQGRKKIEISVSDSLGKMASGTFYITVKPQGSMDPSTNADHVVTRVGQAVTVSPLSNDTSAGREPLRLTHVDEVKGATVSMDGPNKQLTFQSPTEGTYYVQYLASAGVKSAIGIVRVDVLGKSESEQPPVAVRDVALLPSGKEALIGVLANDSDPAGGVLVVQSVTVPPHSGIAVSVLNHETLRITDQGALSEQVRIRYRISNGTQSAEGDVIVVPIPAASKLLPPTANDDEAFVRVGDVVTIPVLSNDTHPNDDAIHVAPDLIEPLVEPEVGEAFVSQDAVRFRAGTEPGTAYITYEVVDSLGQKDAGYVTVQILPIDKDRNAAPSPRDLTVRTVSGTSANVAIPLDGIDGDGDSVELVGVATAPTKGRISSVAQDHLVYEAFDDSTGVDAFTYIVRDRLGKEGTASIRVGIAPPENMNQAPYAVKDAVVVRPGRSVAVPVLGNDSDPDGDKIALVKDGIELPKVEGLTAEVSGDRVVIDVPDREAETSLQYTIRDARGANATAPVFITVDEDVPLLVPVARDDRVMQSDLKDGLTVDLDILANDEDPDGTVEGLKVAVDAGAELMPDRTVRVTVGEKRQLIKYTITDQDGLSASAFVFVPALKEIPPSVPKAKAVEVKSGETKVLPLKDYVVVTGGGDVRITEAGKVSAVNSDGANLVQDERTLVYTSKDRYFGPDALTFEVTDGTGPDDPNGRKATLTIPIEVLPPENQQPEFVDSQLDVAPGEDATSLDLAGLTTDPDPEDAGKISYSISAQPSKGLSARIEGSTLLVEADSNTRKGTVSTVELRIDDGTTDPVKGQVTVTVAASTRSLPVASPDSVNEADQGETITVPVLENDINPFPETPLKLVASTLESGQATQKIVGDKLEITPDKTFVGVVVVRYRIQDVTEDADREVDGRVTVLVQGIPDAPGQPTVSSIQDRTVVLSWSPPANNGAEITEYTVTSVGGSPYTKTCTSTTCTLDGLTNNVEYTFQVTATNRVGEGPASAASNPPARPDVRPDTPSAPSLVFGDKSLEVSWVTPASSGSPVDSYTLQISPAPPSGSPEKTGVTGNSLVWEGLENGASYTVRVQAHNKAPDPSSFSGWSLAEIPAGPPLAPAQPTTAELAPVGKQAQMDVRWGEPSINGDAIRGYQIQVLRGGTLINTVPAPADARSQAIVVDTSETGYTYKVRAENKAGWGDWSDASAARRGVVAPDAPTGLTAEPKDRAIQVSYQQGDRHGATAGEISIQYRLDGGGWQSNWDGRTITGLNNGTNYRVDVRAVASVSGSTYVGAASNAASANPYGTPRAPTVSAVNAGLGVKLSWNGSNSDNGRPVTVQVSIDGGGWQNVAVSSSTTAGNGYDQTHSIKARAVASPGGNSPESNTASARTDPKPQPKAWTSAGPNSGKCSPDTCYYLRVNVSNFPAGNYALTCLEDGQKFGGGWTSYVPANGYVDTGCWHGGYNSKYALSVRIEGWGTADATRWN
ncbi:Ig-like domain-containing protein [Microbacterium sp. H1-D42]|uniref:Ig-like domain-containing protein n=1 Tax=Microbacterium sp. H1-D42 TaxID=2925844 RepID=UPI001F52E86A|nr:Ig-like domain-containing protein [Microbacterium sp. H1-D42]UNK70427.1 Ig-like domain-containing protein [Microbacterium sp. H1-D42]